MRKYKIRYEISYGTCIKKYVTVYSDTFTDQGH